MLGFSRRFEMVGGRRIRTLALEDRSIMPVSSACIVASGVRETLTSLFGEAVALKLYEPTIPQPAAWSAIVRDANVYRVRCATVDAAVIVRSGDASALAAAAFGEREVRAGALSVLERTVLERVVRAIAMQFGPICGAAAELVLDLQPDMRTFCTYFELQLERPVYARIGIALSRDPLPDSQGGLTVDDLLDLELELALHVDGGEHPAAEISALEPGDMLLLPPGPLRGTIRVAGRGLVVGECGVRGRYYAVAVHSAPTGREDSDR